MRAGVDDRATAETLGIDIAKVFALVFGIGTYLAGVAGVVAAPIFGVYPGMDVSIIILVLIVVVVGGLGSLQRRDSRLAADRICRHLRQAAAAAVRHDDDLSGHGARAHLPSERPDAGASLHRVGLKQ